MKLKDILKKVGASVVKHAVPSGGLLIDVVNTMLPDDKKLLQDATGNDINTAIQSLSPADRIAILQKDFDVKLTEIKETNETLRVMLETDAKHQHTTRPYIARHSFHVVAFVIVCTTSLWAYAIFNDMESLLLTITQGWPFVLSVIGPFTTLLYAYFGVLKQEHRARLNTSIGKEATEGFFGALGKVFKR